MGFDAFYRTAWPHVSQFAGKPRTRSLFSHMLLLPRASMCILRCNPFAEFSSKASRTYRTEGHPEVALCSECRATSARRLESSHDNERGVVCPAAQLFRVTLNVPVLALHLYRA